MAEKLPRMMERKYWIDWAKVFGIYLVVLGHSLDGSMLLWKWIYSFHMPFFFMISGYLDKAPNTDIVGYIKKTSKRLLIPYLLFGTISIFANTQMTDTHNVITDGIKLLVGRPSYFASSLWFVFSLFEVKILSATVNVLSAKKIWLKYAFYIFLLCFLVIVILMHIEGENPYWTFTFLVAIPFFDAGRLLRKNENKLFKTTNKVTKTIIVITALLLPFLSIAINGNGDMHDPSFGDSVVLYYLLSISASSAILFFFKSFVNISSKVIVTLSDGTILILALHMLVIQPLNGYELPIYLRIILCLAVVAAFYYPIVFCQKYCPILIGKKRSN